MKFKVITFAVLVCIGMARPALATPQIGQPAPDFTLQGADGKKHSLSDYKGKVTVLEWTNPQCPYVRKHYGSGTMQKLQADMAGQGVAWLRIDSSAPGMEGYLTPQSAAALAVTDGSHQTAFLLDPDGTAGHLYDATTTPDMAVIGRDGTLRYIGAIDDAPSADPATLVNAKSYVREAVADVLLDKPVLQPVTQPYGCGVKYKN